MYKKLLIFAALFAFFSVQAQFLHHPKDIQQIMERSSLFYVPDTVILNEQMRFFPIIESMQLSTSGFRTEKKVKKYHTKAKKAYKKQQIEKSVRFYEKALREAPHHFVLQKELAPLYIKLYEYEKAIALYLQIIETQPFDFQNYRHLTTCYKALHQYEEAMHYSLLAHLYNRNHSDTKREMIRIFSDNFYFYKNWTLNPAYKIAPNSDSTAIVIRFEEEIWGAYACCKAVWKYEKGYADEMQYLSDNSSQMIEEKECFYNALVAFAKNKTPEQYPALIALEQALKWRLLDEYLLYEKFSRERPELVFALSIEMRDRLLAYIKKMHFVSIEEHLSKLNLKLFN